MSQPGAKISQPQVEANYIILAAIHQICYIQLLLQHDYNVLVQGIKNLAIPVLTTHNSRRPSCKVDEGEEKEQKNLEDQRSLSRSSSSASDEGVILDRSSYDLVMEEVVDLRAMLLTLRRVLHEVRTPLHCTGYHLKATDRYCTYTPIK